MTILPKKHRWTYSVYAFAINQAKSSSWIKNRWQFEIYLLSSVLVKVNEKSHEIQWKWIIDRNRNWTVTTATQHTMHKQNIFFCSNIHLCRRTSKRVADEVCELNQMEKAHTSVQIYTWKKRNRHNYRARRENSPGTHIAHTHISIHFNWSDYINYVFVPATPSTHQLQMCA